MAYGTYLQPPARRSVPSAGSFMESLLGGVSEGLSSYAAAKYGAGGMSGEAGGGGVDAYNQPGGGAGGDLQTLLEEILKRRKKKKDAALGAGKTSQDAWQAIVDQVMGDQSQDQEA